MLYLLHGRVGFAGWLHLDLVWLVASINNCCGEAIVTCHQTPTVRRSLGKWDAGTLVSLRLSVPETSWGSLSLSRLRLCQGCGPTILKSLSWGTVSCIHL